MKKIFLIIIIILIIIVGSAILIIKMRAVLKLRNELSPTYVPPLVSDIDRLPDLVKSSINCNTLPEPKTAVTYYVAINELGASNENCDGLAPTNDGNGRCPFKDFSSIKVREKLFRSPEGFTTIDGNIGTKSVTMKIREGTYFIHPMEFWQNEPLQPLVISSAGENQNEAVVLMSYNKEKVILDGTCPTIFRECNSPEDPGRIWKLLHILGNQVIVQGLTFDNVHKWNIEFGSPNTYIQCNEFIGSYGSDSDSIKVYGEKKEHSFIRNNIFKGPYEQAIDGADAHKIIVEYNDFSDGMKGVGFKRYAEDSIIRYNKFHDLKEKAIDLGGHEIAAKGIIAEHNVIYNIGKYAAEIGGCIGCSFNYNDVTNAKVGIRSWNSSSISKEIKIFGNRFRDIKGSPEFPNVFMMLHPDSVADFEADNNLYCVALNTKEGFVQQVNEILDFKSWQSKTGADQHSKVALRNEKICDW